MATLSESSIFESLFQSALDEYEKQTGINLLGHPLAAQLESCNSVESITQVLQDQAQAFRQFRGGDNKVLKLLKNAVQVLHKLSSTMVLGEAVGLPAPLVKAIHTGIGTLLAAVKDVITSYDALGDLLESICNFLKRLDIYTKIPPTTAMTEIIVKIFVQLISTLAVATKQIKQGRLKKFGKKLFGDNDVEAVLHRLDRLTLDEARTTAAQTLEVVYGLVENLTNVLSDGQISTDGIQKALEMIQRLTSDVNKSRRDQLLRDIQRWLAPPDPWKNYNIGLETHHDGTARWFIQGNTLAEWKSSPCSLLWINGKPGSGKSVLCSTVIENIDCMCKFGLASLAFYYFDFREVEKKHRHGFLSSILWQLCDQSDSYYDILSHFYLAHRYGQQSPSDSSLAKCLKDVFSSPEQVPVYIIIDGLDECPNTSGTPSAREKVLMLVKDLVDLRLQNLHICLTSRPEIDIKTVLDGLKFHSISLHDEDGQKQDILNYIRSVVHSDPQTQRWREEDKELVIEVLSQNANGMFRWVFCQFDFLRGCLPARIRQAVAELPDTLDETYERILREIKKANWEFAHRLLQCVAVASRPLRVEELAEILAFDFEAGPIPEFQENLRLEDPVDAVLSTCSSLLAVINVEDSWVVQFSHFSVKEYLTSSRLADANDITSRRHHISTIGAHTLAAQACLGILFHLDKNVTRDTLQKFPLAEYAAEHWVDHARIEGVGGNMEDGMKKLFDPRTPHFAIWVWVYDLEQPSSRRPKRPLQPRGTPLHYAALCGLSAIVEFLVIEHSQDVHSLAFENNSTPLHVAGWWGHVEVARVLLECGADTTAQDKHGSTPLHLASSGGHVELACVLLKYGADATARANSGWTPLHYASWEGHVELACVLLESGAGVGAQANDNSTPLHWASQVGHVELVRILLERGADATAQATDGKTPLHLASSGGHVELSHVLLERDAGVTAQNNTGSTPLHLASWKGHVEFVRVLLECGADATAQNNTGSTPLHLASWKGHAELARVVLECGTDTTAQDNNGWTPLHRASWEGQAELARVLLECGADATAQDKIGQTPLHWASRKGHAELARVLLKCGADATAQDNRGWSPLHWASWEGHAELARVHLECGADVTAQDNGGWTPLHWASWKGHVEFVRVLLECGADATVQDSERWTPLHLVSWEGHAELARVLLKCGADVTAQDNEGWTPLHQASCEGHAELARILLECGAAVTAQDNEGWTPLHLASSGGHVEVIRVLGETRQT